MQGINYQTIKLKNCKTIMCMVYEKTDIDTATKLVREQNEKDLIILVNNERYYKILNQKNNKLGIDESKITYIINNNDMYYNLNTNEETSFPTVDAIIFSRKCSQKELIRLKKYVTKVIIGQFKIDQIDYYEVWKEYRDICETIYLEVIMQNGKIEKIEWEKRNSNIELSVIFPVYNVEKYLEKCLETVTAWNVDYIEFLFINDGSPDNSAKLLREYSKKDPRVKVIDKENGGCASARKLGLEKAQGKYIGFIDPDDFIDPDMFLQLHKRALLGSYQVAYCGYNEYYENTKTVKKVTQDAIYYPYSEGVRDPNEIKKLIMYLRVAIWRGIYLKSMLDDNKITFNENLRRFDDLPFKIEVFAKARSVVSVPENMYYYRLERPGQDVACSDERLYVHFDIFDYLDKKQELIQDNRVRDYLQISKFQTHIYALEKIDNKYFNTYVRKMKKDMKHNMASFRENIILEAYLGRKSVEKKYLIKLGMGKLIIKDKTKKRKVKNIIKQRNYAINKLKKLY